MAASLKDDGGPEERAGRVQALVAEEARRLDPVSRRALMAALWRGVDRAADTVSAGVFNALLQATVAGHNVETRHNVTRDFEEALHVVSDDIERLQFMTLVASAVSPPPPEAPPPGAHEA